MRAARLIEVGRLEAVEAEEPAPGPGEVLVRVAHAGLCGTDRHLLRGEFLGRTPCILGHEFSGEIIAVGDGVDPSREGERVACDPNIACGACPPCLAGRVNLCENLVAIGVVRDGGFAERVAIPAHRALRLPDGLGLRAAAFAEPLSCCLHAADLAAVRPGERAVVLGGGVIGLLMLQLLRLAGAEVAVVTRSAARQRVAADHGAALVTGSGADLLRAWPRGAEVVVDCAGVADTLREAPSLAARGGRVVLFGVLARGARVEIDPLDLLVREVSLLPAFLNPFTMGRALGLLASGAVRTGALVTREVGIDELPAVVAADPGPSEVKVLATP